MPCVPFILFNQKTVRKKLYTHIYIYPTPARYLACLANALLLNVALYCNKLLISLTQSSSFPGPAPSSERSYAGSEILERLIHGIGYGEARTVTESPGARTRASCPSRETPAGARERSPIYYNIKVKARKKNPPHLSVEDKMRLR